MSDDHRCRWARRAKFTPDCLVPSSNPHPALSCPVLLPLIPPSCRTCTLLFFIPPCPVIRSATVVSPFPGSVAWPLLPPPHRPACSSKNVVAPSGKQQGVRVCTAHASFRLPTSQLTIALISNKKTSPLLPGIRLINVYWCEGQISRVACPQGTTGVGGTTRQQARLCLPQGQDNQPAPFTSDGHCSEAVKPRQQALTIANSNSQASQGPHQEAVW